MAHTETPLRFTDTLPPALRTACWLPRETLTLAWWPCGQGYTVHEVKYSPEHRLIAHNVALITPLEEASSCSPRSNDSMPPMTTRPGEAPPGACTGASQP
jgi:hypothetical protein